MNSNSSKVVTEREIFLIWLPLWLSWLAMMLENPLVTAFIGRGSDATVQLAALAGVVIPIAFLIEGPIVCWLSASNALVRDLRSYNKLFRYMIIMSTALTCVHGVVALTPVYDLVTDVLNIPSQLIEPGRYGLALMLPWTLAIAHRRFHQGILIRFGHANLVTYGTAIRLGSSATVLTILIPQDLMPGVAAAGLALSIAVLSEAVYVRIVCNKVLKSAEFSIAYAEGEITNRSFLHFFAPLSLTTLLDFVLYPVCSAAIGRMPLPIVSYAALQVLMGISFAFRSIAISFTEVTIANYARPGGVAALNSFMKKLVIYVTLSYFIFILTPISDFWIVTVLGMSEEILKLSLTALWLGALHVIASPFKENYKGRLIQSKNTRPVTEGTLINILVLSLCLILGVLSFSLAGIFIVMIGRSLAVLCEAYWLKLSWERA